jgi:CshA-type fibril repeat protein
MKLTNFKILPLIFAGSVLLGLSGCDKGSGTASDSALVGVPPVAVNDTGVGVSGAAATISVVANDTDVENNLDVASVQIIGTATPGDSLVVAGEGTWSVSVTGSVTFTPETGFTNDPSVIEYIVSDTGGLASNIATVTIDYPQTAPVAVDDDKNGTSGLPTTVDVLANDTDEENDINASSLQITGTTNPGDSLVVASEGTWSISSNDRIVFTPESGFTGDPTLITYTVTDNTDLTSNEATVTVDYPQTAPVANPDDTNETALNTPATLNVVENDTDAESDINASTVNFVDIDGINTDSDDDNDRLEVAGEGNWTVDEDGNVTFSPDANFTGDPTPIFYTVTDNTGLESNEANVTIDYPQVTVSTFENNTSLALTDGATVTSTINVTDATTSITKVIVNINTSGIVPYDNEYRLEGPSGTIILLADNKGAGPTFIATFDDDATILMSDQTSASTIDGTYVPEEPLSTFNGENANGIWTLIVIDNIGGWTNTLNGWSLTIE